MKDPSPFETSNFHHNLFHSFILLTIISQKVSNLCHNLECTSMMGTPVQPPLQVQHTFLLSTHISSPPQAEALMELYGQRTILSFLDEEQKTFQSPPRLSMNTHQRFYEYNSNFISSERPSSASTIQVSPPSPESPWKLTPLDSSPSPTLLYQCIASLQRHGGNIFSITVSRGVVYTGSESSRVRIWRQPDCIERGCLKTSSGWIRAILASGNLLFTTHKDYKIRMWKVSVSDNFGPKKITTLPPNNSYRLFRRTNQQKHKDFISCIAYYSGEGLLYTGSWDKTVKAWRVCDKKCIDSFVAHEDNINAILVHQEDGSVFTCSSDGSVKIWRRVFGENSHALTMTLKLLQSSPVNALALSSASMNSCYLYSGSSDGLINFWEKETISRRFNHGGFLEGHQFAVLCLVAIERLVFSGSEDTTIRVWRREEGTGFNHTCLAVLDGHRGPVKCLAACLEMEKVVMGFLVYSTSLDRTLKVWRVKVFPGERKANVEVRATSRFDPNLGVTEYEMSPVLSPSWVEKKLQDNHLH